MKILLARGSETVENVQGVIRLDCPGRGQASVSELEAVLEIYAAGIV